MKNSKQTNDGNNESSKSNYDKIIETYGHVELSSPSYYENCISVWGVDHKTGHEIMVITDIDNMNSNDLNKLDKDVTYKLKTIKFDFCEIRNPTIKRKNNIIDTFNNMW